MTEQQTISSVDGSVYVTRSPRARHVVPNRCDYLGPALARTGVKDNGRGVTLSTLGYPALTRSKSLHLRTEL